MTVFSVEALDELVTIVSLSHFYSRAECGIL